METIRSMLNEYREKYVRGLIPRNDYDDCRFASDKVKYAKDWLLSQRKINLNDPQTIVDVICKEKIDLITAPYEKLIKKQKWSDKIAVYDEMKKLGLEDLLIPCELRCYMNQANENIFRNLEEGVTYIIKTNHGSGWNIKYTHGKTDKQMVLNKLNEWLNTNYAYISGYELQYKFIKPGILIQRLITETPLDWSFWCKDGNIEGVGLTKKYGKNWEEYVAFTDKDGNRPNWYIGMEPAMLRLNNSQKEILERMKPIVAKIADGHKFVRVDLYCVNGKIYFGEATFTPCSGILDVSAP